MDTIGLGELTLERLRRYRSGSRIRHCRIRKRSLEVVSVASEYRMWEEFVFMARSVAFSS